MDEIYQKLGLLNLWGAPVSSNETSFEATEGWLQHGSGKIKSRTIHVENLRNWLAEGSEGTGSETQSLVLRLAWVDVDVKSRRVNLSESVKKDVLNKFNLQLAYSYSQSCITNVSAFPPSDGHRAYLFCYMPKLASVWSHRRFETHTLTQGLVFVEKEEKEWLGGFLNTSWDPKLYGNAMFPAFLFSLLLSVQISKTEEEIKKRVRGIEKKTGYHSFANRHEEATTKENGDLSAEANGYASKLASVGRKSKMVEKLLDFIMKMVEEEDRDDRSRVDASLSLPGGSRFLRNHVAVLQDRLAMQQVDTDFTLKRVQIQISELAGIISRTDSISNLKLAESQNTLAKSQHEIAIHSYRDSSSMKTLVIVTMFFLPGSFISALFSTSLFAWDNVDLSSSHIGVGTRPQFKLYWVITIPLTVVTFLLYFLWLWLMKRQSKKRLDNPRMASPEDGEGSFDGLSSREEGETEGARLARARKPSILGEKLSSFGQSS